MANPKYGGLPSNTPITELGVTPKQLAKLTPAARSLTKGDLIALDKWDEAGGVGAGPDHLTVKDLSSLRSAFPNGRTHQVKRQNVAADTTYCCCPCCTCSAAGDIPPVLRTV